MCVSLQESRLSLYWVVITCTWARRSWSNRGSWWSLRMALNKKGGGEREENNKCGSKIQVELKEGAKGKRRGLILILLIKEDIIWSFGRGIFTENVIKFSLGFESPVNVFEGWTFPKWCQHRCKADEKKDEHWHERRKWQVYHLADLWNKDRYSCIAWATTQNNN